MDKNSFIKSGILELYALGMCNEGQKINVEEMRTLYPEVSQELENVEKNLEAYHHTRAIAPPPTVKAFILAGVDYRMRLADGEKPIVPPPLNERSKPQDYSLWLSQEQMQLPENADDIYAKIIGNNETQTTAIVWVKDEVPPETHHSEKEKFMIIEGHCELKVGDETYRMGPGDYREIPLHVAHSAKVTSQVPCKFILERVAV